MNQQISKEHWNELHYKEQKYLFQWKKDITKNRLFTIGEMIEYLRDNYSREVSMNIILNRDEELNELCSISLIKNNEEELLSSGGELCDVLWEIIKMDIRDEY
jgi:hypothetical protein